ncbi:MAG TPA: transglycosylase SLT domain-containing protein [Anaerolineales bacterium]|nr:transglycosylase SLT domain-containing protein [Anaerolineales bacterium]
MNKLFYHNIPVALQLKKYTLILIISLLSLVACAANPNLEPIGQPDADAGESNNQIPTMTPKPTAVATSIPPLLLNPYEKEIISGEFEKIHAEAPFSANVVQDTPQLLFVTAKSYYLQKNFTFALETLNYLLANHPDSHESDLGTYLVGEIYFELERYSEASDNYAKLLGIDPALDLIFLSKYADSLSLSGNYQQAIIQYRNLLIKDPNNESVAIKLGRAEMFGGDYDSALVTFKSLKSTTTNDYTKAQLNLLIGQAYVLKEDLSNAYIHWQENVSTYPLSYDTYNSLVGLTDYGQQVNPIDRAFVNYFAGNPEIAISAFDDYLRENPDPNPDVFYYIGLSQREIGDYTQAIKYFDELITNHAESQFWTSAWDEKAYTYWAYMNDYPSAWEVLENYALNYPQNSTASNYLFEAARIHERFEDLSGAASLWESLPIQFPDSDQIYDSWFQAGIARFRAGDYQTALQNFINARESTSDKNQQAKAIFWVAKSHQALNENPEAIQNFETVVNLLPYSYYGLRSRDLIANQNPFTQGPTTFVEPNMEELKLSADTWIKIRLDLEQSADVENLGVIQDSELFKQGLFYWNVGQFELGRQKFSELRQILKDQPLELYKLSGYMYTIGNYAESREMMDSMLNAIGYSEDVMRVNLPKYLTKMVFPIHFYSQINSAAAKYNLDPYILASIVWQESAFDPNATSSSGALGLLQIMPATGQDIANRSGLVSNYTTESLYDPDKNLLLGAYYLNSNLNYLSNDIFAALAGYNAGPGNAMIWKSLALGDSDLQLEIIRYGETRNYISSIYYAYEMYSLLYQEN